MHDKYMMTKPKIMITHECPEAVAAILSNEMKFADGSRTRQAFNSMWENWKPKLWIFGHWHQSFDKVILDTRFICLNELEFVDVDVMADDPTVLHRAK
jgi:Icc-related predicted phosphoesterase